MGSPNHREYQRLFDYFAIIGLNPDGDLEPNNIQGCGQLVPPLDRSYLPTVLGHYPDTVPGQPSLDHHALQMLCLPKGLQLRTQKQSLEAVYHPFLITREDGTRCYGFSYTFYEEVNTQHICTALHSLQAAYLADISSSTNGAAAQAGGAATTGDVTDSKRDTRSLPREFRWSSPKSSAGRMFYDLTKDQLFVSKSIVLIGRQPEVAAARKFLVGLYKLFTGCEAGPVTLESHVHNLLYEVHVPPPGRCLAFSCVGQPQLCYRPTTLHELPLFLYPLRELFSLVSPECVVQLLSSILLENQVLLVSSDYYRLMLIAESMCSLLFPFTWHHVYVPILPAALTHFLDAPVPFIMGLHATPQAKRNINIPDEANLCLVDVDAGEVVVPEDLPSFPHATEFVAELSKQLEEWGMNTSQHSLNSASSNTTTTAPRHHNQQFPDAHLNKYSTDHPLLDLTHASNVRDYSAAMSRKAGVYDRESLKRALITNGLGSRDSLKENSSSCFNSSSMSDISPNCPEAKAFLEMLQFNSAIRELFLNRFVQMFCTYDNFIIQPNVQEVDMEKWINNRESLQNFDKATFLSDQPVAHLPFLSRFIESQMFASFIDHKILSFWGEVNNNQQLFDARIKHLRERVDDSVIRPPTYETCSTIESSALLLQERLSKIDYLVPPPAQMDPQQQSCTLFNPGHFPLLDKIALNKEPHRSKKTKGSWRRRERLAQHLQHTALSAEQKDKVLNEAKTLHPTLNNSSQPKLTDIAPARIAHTNWKFVEQLLKECKTRTKRMLVEKMGSEAVELGHQETSLMGVEENTLVASLCHLLERVWAHGLQTKQGKSALWSHLLAYQEMESNMPGFDENPNYLSPELSSMALATGSAPASPTHAPNPLLPHSSTAPRHKTSSSSYYTSSSANSSLRKNSTSSSNLYDKMSRLTHSGSSSSISSAASSFNPLRPNSADHSSSSSQGYNSAGQTSSSSSLPHLPVSITFDMRNVLAMTEIKTEIGYARAWLRLSLEKKLLSKHLAVLLSDAELLRSLYKRYAFLRCDDEKEQFLSYLLSLNAVDYYCFTHTYTTTKVYYRVVLFTSRKLSAATTTANAWVSLSGSLDHTPKIPLNKSNQNEIVFQHKNLGLLSTLRVGHDNYGMSPKWLVEHVIVRNEITGHTWRFPCGRWLGKGIDDGSLERILVGEMVPSHVSSEDIIQSCKTPPRCRSPTSGPRRTDIKLNVGEIQQLLGDAVNNLVKFFYKPEKERGSLTVLLCGDLGLVACLELVFSYGFKSARFFGKNLYLWDYLERVEQEFEVAVREERARHRMSGIRNQQGATVNAVMAKTCGLITTINTKTTHLGKDDKFQLFICIAAREHLLHRLLMPLNKCSATAQLYEDYSFLRDPQLLKDLINVLAAINDFDIVLEDSLTRGIDN